MENLEQKLAELKASLETVVDAKAKVLIEAQIKAVNEAVAADVKKLNEELAAKGATILDIQNEVRELKAKGGRIRGANERVMSLKSIISKAIGDAGDTLQRLTTAVDEKGVKGMRIETKAVADMTSANLTGDTYQTYLDWRPGMRPMGQTRFRDFVRSIPSATDYVQFPRDTGGEGSFAQQANEGDAKSQVDRDFGMIDVTLKPLAGYTTVSRQSLRNIPFLQEYLPQTMLEDLLDAEDTLFSAALVAAGTGSTTSDGANEIEKIIHYIRNLRKAKHNPNGIACDPDVWSNILITQTSGGGYNLPNVVAVDANGVVRILGRPVYEVNWLTGGNVIVGDWNKVAIVESEGLTMRQSDSHASQFTSNELTYLLERTENIAIFRTDAFVVADLIP